MHRTRWIFLATLVAVVALPGSSAAAEPWRLDTALGAPERLELRLDHRIRYEALHEQFRAGSNGDDDVLMIRTRLHARVRVGGGLSFGAEIQDSRAYLDDPTTPLGTGAVNAVELLQAYAELDHELFGGNGLLRLGRVTLDVGSRRFVARSRFRNTANGFSGVDWRWQGESGRTVRAFYVLPLRRRPANDDEIRDDDIRLDQESFDLQFWGLHGSLPLHDPGGSDRFEAWIFGLHEEAGSEGTRNRDLYTPGFRFWRAPEPGAFDYEFESAFQFGRSRAFRFGPDLDHRAHFHHLEVGYSFDIPWKPRVALQYDYASGDEGFFDGDNERFDPLYGARRFDFGPTSIYGPFSRTNVNTPGVRVQVKPRPGVSSFVAVRGFWLASDRDAWGGTGVRDISGGSGKFLGTQVEWRFRWDLLPGNVRFETGLAYLFDGEFLRRAPNSNHGGDSAYAYAQLGFRI